MPSRISFYDPAVRLRRDNVDGNDVFTPGRKIGRTDYSIG
jgi:hypothetical protein